MQLCNFEGKSPFPTLCLGVHTHVEKNTHTKERLTYLKLVNQNRGSLVLLPIATNSSWTP